MANKQIQNVMQQALDKLGIPLTVVLIPDPNRDKHGEIKASTLFVYDKDQTEAWSTLTHEIFEFKLKQVTFVYRTIINSLIEALEKVAYTRKEQFLEFLPKLSKTIEEAKRLSATES